MSLQPVQLTFDLAPRPALGVEDFLVSPSNEDALRSIEAWPAWPHHALILHGPAQSGKTHLGQVWRLASRADAVVAAELAEVHIGRLEACGALLIENLERGVADERLLFHVLNTAREKGLSVLLTTRIPAASLPITLPDLSSRLKAVPATTIQAPDPLLLKAVLVKHFADRQLAVEPAIVETIATRMQRSMAMAQTLVAAIDERSLARKRKVTRALVLEVLAELGEPLDDDTDVRGT
jgi:chromosomal replication initiation ATPase DnaA